TTVAASNIIAGNQGDGIAITSKGSGTLVQGNYIGVVGATGTTPLGNTGNGVRVTNASATIGGTTADTRNVISRNGRAGVLGNNDGSAQIQGNYIGLGGDGSTKVGNKQQGVFLASNKASTVGGTVAGARNVISGNGTHGVDMLHAGSGHLVLGNYIGTNAAGTA